jgi:hypothetical protein
MKLIFTANQAYLHCKCGWVSEESLALDAFHFRNEYHLSVSGALKSLERFDAKHHDDTLWNEYSGFLQGYTPRELSFPEDVLNAFSAILGNLERKWKAKFIFGLPESQFALALQWKQPDQKLRRRDCTIQIQRGDKVVGCPAPSWSWVGWIGWVVLPYDPAQEKDQYNSNFEVEWTLSDREVPLPLADPTRYTLLQALAPRTFFDVGELQWNSFHGYAHPIVNATGKLIWYVPVPSCSYWTARDVGQSGCEFVALTASLKARFFRDEKRVIDEENLQVVVKAMMISQRINGVAFRIGIASIHWDDWQAANPVEKLITLG